ncbi:MAG: alpha-L-fucosidase, partial [Chitinophagaceae bacterium]
DGGWVRPRETVNEEVLSWGARIPDWSQDIDMPRIAAMGRDAQPGLLIVDRTVHGPYENYQTPEQRIPEKQLPNPWESCMTLATNWGHVPGDTYKSPGQVIHSLIEVVAKGGSLLLGVGPKPDGTLPEDATTRMAAVGKWLRKNGDAIYGTRTVGDYHQGNVWFTQKKDSSLHYALVTIDTKNPLTSVVTWRNHVPKKGSKVVLLETGKAVNWSVDKGALTVTIPASVRAAMGEQPALAFSFIPE